MYPTPPPPQPLYLDWCQIPPIHDCLSTNLSYNRNPSYKELAKNQGYGGYNTPQICIYPHFPTKVIHI